MKYLFVNGSPNKKGNTAALAQAMFDNNEYETLDLIDYKIYSYGQSFQDDQFSEVLAKMKEADNLVIGSPVYWHNLSGIVRNLIDRFYGTVEEGGFHGKKLFVLFQGAAPKPWMLENTQYTMNRFAALYGMEYMGMATDIHQARDLGRKLGNGRN